MRRYDDPNPDFNSSDNQLINPSTPEARVYFNLYIVTCIYGAPGGGVEGNSVRALRAELAKLKKRKGARSTRVLLNSPQQQKTGTVRGTIIINDNLRYPSISV